MARNHLAYNTTDSPVVVDGEGRTLGGRERGRVDPDSPAVRRAAARGALLLTDDRTHPEPPPPDTETDEQRAAAAALLEQPEATPSPAVKNRGRRTER